MHLASENRAVARLVDAAQFLHDRRRQADLEAGDRAAAARDTDRLEFLPDRIGLIEIGRRELRRQDVDLLPLAEQRGDALGFLVDVQSILLLIFTTETRRAGRSYTQRSHSRRKPGPTLQRASGSTVGPGFRRECG